MSLSLSVLRLPVPEATTRSSRNMAQKVSTRSCSTALCSSMSFRPSVSFRLGSMDLSWSRTFHSSVFQALYVLHPEILSKPDGNAQIHPETTVAAFTKLVVGQ
jgi:hypothetical protein